MSYFDLGFEFLKIMLEKKNKVGWGLLDQLGMWLGDGEYLPTVHEIPGSIPSTAE